MTRRAFTGRGRYESLSAVVRILFLKYAGNGNEMESGLEENEFCIGHRHKIGETENLRSALRVADR